jgi:hypothetical protein
MTELSVTQGTPQEIHNIFRRSFRIEGQCEAVFQCQYAKTAETNVWGGGLGKLAIFRPSLPA